MNKDQKWDEEKVNEILSSLRDKEGALLPILHAIQTTQGYIPKGAIPAIAQALHQTVAEIHGVISFYEDFRTEPTGRNIIQICRAEACQARGARQLEQHAKQKLSIDFHGTTPDQEFTLQPAYCLGNCACGPSLRVNNDIVAEVHPEKFDALLSKLTTYVVELS